MLDPSPTTRGAPIADSAAAPDRALWIWRHPRAQQTQGRCIGRTDLAVSARRAKRLAHRIRQTARRVGLARCAHLTVGTLPGRGASAATLGLAASD